MKGPELHIMIRQLLNNQGTKFLKDKRLVNILNDMNCFDNCNNCKGIIKDIVESNLSDILLSYINGNDTKEHIFKHVITALTKDAYQEHEISYALQSLMYGLNVIDYVNEYSIYHDYSWISLLDDKKAFNTSPINEWNSEYIVLDISPEESEIYIDGNKINKKYNPFAIELNYGVHNILVTADMFHNYEGQFPVQEGTNEHLTIELKPKYGSILVMTNNAKEAVVYIDDNEIGISPISINKLKSGIHTLKVHSTLYNDYKEVFELKDGEFLQRCINLVPNYGTIKLISKDPNIEIYIDSNYVGKGSWTGTLRAGLHNVECRKDSYFSKGIDIIVMKDENSINSFELPELNAIYGCLKVNVVPIGSSVLLDGMEIGKTPLKCRNILIGKHKLEIIDSTGYSIVEKDIEIKQNEITTIDELIPLFYFREYSQVRIGDYYYKDGSFSHIKSDAKEAIGVVFSLEVSNENKEKIKNHGQLISLKNLKGGTQMTWKRANEIKLGVNDNYSEWSIPTCSQWEIILKNIVLMSDFSSEKKYNMLSKEVSSRLKSILNISDEVATNLWTSDKIGSCTYLIRLNPRGNCIEFLPANDAIVAKTRLITSF